MSGREEIEEAVKEAELKVLAIVLVALRSVSHYEPLSRLYESFLDALKKALSEEELKEVEKEAERIEKKGS
uniref:HALC3_109 n=1 Tax=synthetic construct TaxID=32630 RepID=UPI0021C4C953|nr:Chain A, HALC3_109 [synthetic construct]8D07_B Chain B, HALC3_109 [synthetic construct]8D07_C Chain C, HALC3_109 [synthetic construct]8D07_D Chain D, HALC3_109 [synthetic construct]8D07_E Chain E, HALC3_109 [synthetic construct]8D07_F Chain F, HALC3_109 [synthetic construct]